jgi:hypothetical protein
MTEDDWTTRLVYDQSSGASGFQIELIGFLYIGLVTAYIGLTLTLWD